jgi:hypothetical protein
LAYNRADLEGPAEIADWVDLPPGEENEERGVTGLCPRCGIDAVLPDNVPGAPLTAELLAVMRQHWFESSTGIKLRD